MRRFLALILTLLVASFATVLAPGASAGANGGPVSANSIQTILFQWVTYGAGKFVAVGRADSNVTKIFTSTDGSSWT